MVNCERNASIRIPPEQAGSQLLDLVARRFTYRSREEWEKELAAGRFLLNNAPAAAGTRLAAGDLLVYRMPVLPEPPVDFNYKVLYEDSSLLAVDKPAPLPCHPGGRYFRHTLWARLREEQGLERPAFINRLDRETSGLVLIAKTRRAARACQSQFAGRHVDKRYLVLVEGQFPEGVQAAGWLAPDPGSCIRKKIRFSPADQETPGAVACSTSFRLLAVAEGLSLVEARPHTGRCHQIRATLLSLGFPVVGDKLYGPDERFFLRLQDDALTPVDQARLRLPRQALHAARLTIRHPESGRELRLAAPLPEAFQAVFPASLLNF